jgi:hypothetical protein
MTRIRPRQRAALDVGLVDYCRVDGDGNGGFYDERKQLIDRKEGRRCWKRKEEDEGDGSC